MKPTTDDVRRATRLSEDERAWRKEQRAKRVKRPDPPKIPDGPCCARCVHWIEPPSWAFVSAGFRYCERVAILTKREQAPGREKGYILSMDELKRAPLDEHAEWTYLHTTAGFGCRLFRGEGDVARGDAWPQELDIDPEAA